MNEQAPFETIDASRRDLLLIGGERGGFGSNAFTGVQCQTHITNQFPQQKRKGT